MPFEFSRAIGGEKQLREGQGFSFSVIDCRLKSPHSSTSTAVVFTAFNVIRHKSNINLCLTAEHGPVCFILPLRSQDLYVKPLNNETD